MMFGGQKIHLNKNSDNNWVLSTQHTEYSVYIRKLFDKQRLKQSWVDITKNAKNYRLKAETGLFIKSVIDHLTKNKHVKQCINSLIKRMTSPICANSWNTMVAMLSSKAPFKVIWKILTKTAHKNSNKCIKKLLRHILTICIKHYFVSYCPPSTHFPNPNPTLL